VSIFMTYIVYHHQLRPATTSMIDLLTSGLKGVLKVIILKLLRRMSSISTPI